MYENVKLDCERPVKPLPIVKRPLQNNLNSHLIPTIVKIMVLNKRKISNNTQNFIFHPVIFKL